MPSSSRLFALAAAVSTANAAFQGFNYGATFSDGRVKTQSDFEAEFKTAAGLEGTNGAFTSARLYTMVQGGTPNDPISAIPAAIGTKTSLLFGLWASAGEAAFKNEIAALQKTIDQYCDQLDGLVAGISVGSEDLYRITPIGQKSNAGPGAKPETLAGYIGEVRNVVKGSCLKDIPIGHVDTWTAYVEDSNKPLIDACDWLGMDAYPYFEDAKPNSVENGKELFQSALEKTQAAGGGKPVWITETGWPVSGKTSGKAVASTKNAENYYQQVGCPMFGNTNVWWYTLQDSAPTTPNPSFGIIGSELTKKPVHDLSCDKVVPSSSAVTPTSAKPTTMETPTSTQDSSAPPESDSTSATAEPTTILTSATGEETSTQAATTLTTASVPSSAGSNPSPTTDAGNDNTSSAGNGSPSAPTTTGGQSGPSPTASTVPGSSANKMSSFGAAAVAVLFVAVAL